MCGVGDGAFLSVEPASRCDVSFDAEDWFDMCGVGFRIELNGAEEVSMVGNGYGVGLELTAAFEQSVESYCAVEQGVFAVQVKVRKFFI